MITDIPILHTEFKLEGISFNRDSLLDAAYSMIKEGEPFEMEIGDFLMDWLSEDSFVEVTTSGSTGPVKSIRLPKESMQKSALATASYFSLETGMSCLLCLPGTTIAGQMMLVRAMTIGMDIHYIEPSSRPMDFIMRDFDFAAMVPMQLEGSLNKISQIRTLIVGGAPVPMRLMEKLQDLPTAVFETYGMTETCSHIAVRRLNDRSGQIGPFKTLPGVTVTTDSDGQLVIHTPWTGDEPIITRDRVELISDTEFSWIGRTDNIVNSGGVKLSPEQLEGKIAPFIPSDFFLTGAKDDTLGQKLVLVVEGDHSEKEILKSLKEKTDLKPYEQPKKAIGVKSFLRTRSGKILRRQIVEELGL